VLHPRCPGVPDAHGNGIVGEELGNVTDNTELGFAELKMTCDEGEEEGDVSLTTISSTRAGPAGRLASSSTNPHYHISYSTVAEGYSIS
jgi:hypothetical protein